MANQRKENLAEINRDIIRAINREISLKAKKFSDQLLSSVFRAIFRVEQALEFAEPEVFQLEHAPERIAWSRLDSYKLRNLPIAIANEEVCANRYQLLTEYDFVVLADVSRSMMLDWWAVYKYMATIAGNASVAKNEPFKSKWWSKYDRNNIENTFRSRNELRTSKLYFLKYILLSFLHAAKRNHFNHWVKLFGGNRVITYSSRDDSYLEESILNQIDQHFTALVESRESETAMMPKALQEVLDHKKRCIVLFISDFMDGVPLLSGKGLGHAKLSLLDFVPYLAEIAYRHKMLVFRINDVSEKRLHEMGEEVGIDNPYYDVESNPAIKGGRINSKYSKLLNVELNSWQKRLAETLCSLGIDFETFDAGSLASIDKAIYRLGLVTGV